jgi:polysaccharide export outer membrane protein
MSHYFWQVSRNTAILGGVIFMSAASFAQSGTPADSGSGNAATISDTQHADSNKITPSGSQTVAPVATGSGSQTTGTQSTASQTATPGNTSSIKLDAGDVIAIKVYGAPELSDEQRVSASGDVYLALIGSVPLKGLSPEEAQHLVEDKLRNGGFLREPHVTVFVKEYATVGIAILGEVIKPGTYQLIGSHHLFDVISLAGGETQRAGSDITISHRSDPDHPEHVKLQGDLSTANNVEVFPGDTIVVAKAGVVYVIGDVHAPGGYVIEHDHGITAMTALAMAQGNNPTAALKHARIVRRDATGTATEINVDLKKIEEAKAPDVPMQNEDVLFIPTNKSASMMHTTAGAILNGVVGMAITHPY